MLVIFASLSQETLDSYLNEPGLTLILLEQAAILGLTTPNHKNLFIIKDDAIRMGIHENLDAMSHQFIGYEDFIKMRSLNTSSITIN